MAINFEDVGELVDALYQPGRRLLGVWGFVGDPPPVKVTAAPGLTRIEFIGEQNMGLVVDFVNSVDEASDFCRDGLPHAIVIEAIQNTSSARIGFFASTSE